MRDVAEQVEYLSFVRYVCQGRPSYGGNWKWSAMLHRNLKGGDNNRD